MSHVYVVVFLEYIADTFDWSACTVVWADIICLALDIQTTGMGPEQVLMGSHENSAGLPVGGDVMGACGPAAVNVLWSFRFWRMNLEHKNILVSSWQFTHVLYIQIYLFAVVSDCKHGWFGSLCCRMLKIQYTEWTFTALCMFHGGSLQYSPPPPPCF